MTASLEWKIPSRNLDGPTKVGPLATALFVPRRADISSVIRDDNMSAFDVTCIVSGF